MVGMHWPGCSGSRYLVALPDQDVNDADRLRHDPAMRWIVGGKAAQRSAVRRVRWGASRRNPTHGEQEMSVWSGHYACTCYHPLFVFNQFGDLERCAACRQRAQR